MTGPKTVVRPDARGEPDDIVVEDVSLFRIERMDAGRVWLACYRGDRRIVFWLTARTPIAITVGEDDLGARDDADQPIPAADVERTIAALGMDAERAAEYTDAVRERFGIT